MHPLAATRFADWPRDFIDSCMTMHLTIKRGPKAGTTLVYCTCGWERTYPTVVGAKRGENAHLRLNAHHTPAPAGGDAAPTSRGGPIGPAGAPIPTTSEPTCDTCHRLLSCVGTCPKGCEQ